jgi:hypothetical protein
MGNRELALDEIAVVLRIEDRPLDVLAGEGADDVERLPERDGQELLAVAVRPVQDGEAAVPRVSSESGAAISSR